MCFYDGCNIFDQYVYTHMYKDIGMFKIIIPYILVDYNIPQFRGWT